MSEEQRKVVRKRFKMCLGFCAMAAYSGPKPITFRQWPESCGSSDVKESTTRDTPLR